MMARMEVALAALCDFASITAEGKVNILGVFGEVNAATLPIALPQCFLVLSFSAAPSEAGSAKHLRIVLMGPDAGAPLISLEQDLPVPASPGPGRRAYFNLMFGMAGLMFPSPGDYAFDVLVNGEPKASIPVRVNAPPTTSEAPHA